MTGFIRGLFGSQGRSEQVSEEQAAQQIKQNDAYYLSSDDARSMGNSEYMRTAKRVKRTFPKTASGQAAALEREISAMELRDSKLGAQPAVGATLGANLTVDTGETKSLPTSVEVSVRRKADTSLDMFRSMAKDIRK